MIAKALATCLLMVAATASAEEVRVTVTRQDCARLIRHTPSADVAYQPGVDVKGREVAPADLPGSGADLKVLPEVLEFTIAVNPVGWGERVTAQKAKAAAEKSLADSIQGRLAAKSSLATLQAENTTLTGTQGTLTTQLGDLQTDLTGLEADLAAMETAIDAGTLKRWDPDYIDQRRAVAAKQTEVTAKQAEVTANAQALTANAAAQASQQAIIDAAPDAEASATAAKSGADATLSSLSARGLDESSMKIGTVTYDIAKGTFLFNGQPLGSAEMRDLAEACARLGVK